MIKLINWFYTGPIVIRVLQVIQMAFVGRCTVPGTLHDFFHHFGGRKSTSNVLDEHY